MLIVDEIFWWISLKKLPNAPKGKDVIKMVVVDIVDIGSDLSMEPLSANLFLPHTQNCSGIYKLSNNI